MPSRIVASTGRRDRWTTIRDVLRNPLVWETVTSNLDAALGRMPHSAAALRWLSTPPHAIAAAR